MTDSDWLTRCHPRLLNQNKNCELARTNEIFYEIRYLLNQSGNTVQCVHDLHYYAFVIGNMCRRIFEFLITAIFCVIEDPKLLQLFQQCVDRFSFNFFCKFGIKKLHSLLQNKKYWKFIKILPKILSIFIRAFTFFWKISVKLKNHFQYAVFRYFHVNSWWTRL